MTLGSQDEKAIFGILLNPKEDIRHLNTLLFCPVASLVDLGHINCWTPLSLVVVGRIVWCILFKTMLCYISKML